MLVNFSELPPDSRIWIYQSNRAFTPVEVDEITKKLSVFLGSWQAHNEALTSAFELRYQRFIIIGVDQHTAAVSGCSIDASVHFIQSIERDYNVDLLDKMNVSYRLADGTIAHETLLDFRKLAKAKAVKADNIVFNNLVATKQEYLDFWEGKAKESWHSRFF